ncbi:hypothetical protein GJ496_002834 [Pomphorhynchus laevis]|nr:hypothetical protein GJ496_002834 [Pomphorhynchus laevis]
MLMLSSSRVERSPRNINHQVFDISRNVNKRKNSRPTKRVTPAKATNLKNPIIKPRPQRKQSNRNVKERCIEYSGLLVEQQIESIFPNKVDTHTQTIVHCPGPSTASKKRKAAFNTRSSFQTNSANNNLKPRNNTSKKGIVRVPPNKKNINTTRPDDKALTNKTRLSAVQRKFNDDNEGIISKSTTFIKETENDNTGKGNRQHDDQIEVTSLNKMNTLGMHENLKTKIIELVPLNLPIRKNSTTTKVYGNHTNATDSELKQNLRSSEQGHKSMSSADLSHGTSEPKLISKTTLPSESSTSNVTSSISHDIMGVGNSVMDMTKLKKDDPKFVCEKRVCQHPHQQMINMLPSEHLNKEPFNSNCMKNKIKRQKNVAVADSNFTAPTRFINSSSERVYEEIIDCDDDRTEVAEIHRNTQSNFNRNQVKSTKLADKPKICQDQCKSRIDPLSRKRARLEDIEPSQHIRNCFRNKCLPAKGSSSTVPAFKIDNGDYMSSQIKNDGKQVTSVVDKQPPEVILEKNKSNPINDQSECKNCVNIWKTSKYVDRKTCKDNEIVDSKSANDADNRSTMASFEVKSITAAPVLTQPITMQQRSFEIAMDRIRTTSQQGDLTQRKNIEIKKVCDSQKYKQSKDIISMNQGKYIEQQSNLHDKHNNPLERKVKDASKSVNNNRQYSTEPLTSKAVTGKVHCSNDTTLNKTGVASTVSDNVARKTYELNNSRQMFRGQKQDNNDRRYRGTYSSNRHLDYIAKVRRYENRDIHNSATRAGNPFSKIAGHGCCSGPYGIGRQRRQNEEMTEQERNTLLENLQLGGYSKNEAHRIMNFNTKPNVVNDTYYCPISKRDPRRIPPIYLQQQGRPYSTIMDNHSAGIKIDQSDQTQIKDKQETKLLNKQLVGYHDSGTVKNTTSEKKSSENLSGRDGYAGCNKDNMNSCWWNPTGLFELNETESSANYRKVNDEFLKKLKKLDNVNYHKFFPDMWAKQMLAADNETLKRITLEEAESLTQSNNKQMHHVEAGANMEVTEINNKDIQLAQTIKGDRQILSCAKDLPNENKTQTDLNAATSIHLLQDENDKSVLIDRYNTDYNIEIDQIVATMSELINNSELCDAPLSQSSDNPDIISADLKSLPSFDYYGSTSLDNVNDYPNCEISTKEHKIETYESVVDKRDKLSSKNNTLAESSTLETVSQGEEIGKQGTTSINISKQKCHSTSFEGDSKHLIQSHKDFSKKRATNKHHIFDFPKKHSSRKHKRYEEQHHKHSKTKKNYKNEGKSDNVTSVGGTVATPTVIGCTEIRPTNLQKLGRRLRSAVHLVKK